MACPAGKLARKGSRTVAGNKTVANDGDVEAFLASVDHPKRVADARVVLEMMERVTGEPPCMWGGSLIGFGQYHYTYASGREGNFFRTGLSPRKTALTIYVMPGFEPYEEQMARLGKFKTGRSCLYVNKLEDVDLGVLEEIVAQSFRDMKEMYPE